MSLTLHPPTGLRGPASQGTPSSRALDADPAAFSHRTELTSESPLWVGAWWVGFLGTGAAAFFIAVPILGYPRQLPGGCPPHPRVPAPLRV